MIGIINPIHMNNRFFWDKMSKSYDKQVNKTYAQAYTDTIEHAKKYLNQESQVLDVACGTGLTTIPLSHFVHSITALDISEGMIMQVRKKTDQDNIQNIILRTGDIFQPELQAESFDVIMTFNLLYFLKDPQEHLKRIHQLLKPGGYFLSATDCMGDHLSFKTRIQVFMSRIGLLPWMSALKSPQLVKMIKTEKFDITDVITLHQKPTNLFIAAKK